MSSSDNQRFMFAIDDPWYKVVEFLQQNWAYIEPIGSGCTVFFVSDTSGVFDQLKFDSIATAEAGLSNNGFSRFNDGTDITNVLIPPEPPFEERPHPNGAIYSSGRFWRN